MSKQSINRGPRRGNPRNVSDPADQLNANLAEYIKVQTTRTLNDVPIPIRLEETQEFPTDHKIFWESIRTGKTNFFKDYVTLIEDIFECEPTRSIPKSKHPKYNEAEQNVFDSAKEKFLGKNKIPFTSGQTYSLIKYVTEKYIYIKLGSYDGNNGLDISFPTDIDHNGEHLVGATYYQHIINTKLNAYIKNCNTSLSGLRKPTFIELIWSYWMEQGMLVQSMIALSRRFQNMRTGAKDPLANLTLDPLRPLNNILWGYIQDTQHRLTIPRRAYEYDHHYGLKLMGTAVPSINSVDSRSKFIGALNNLLIKCSKLYKEVDDLTVKADGFAVLNALREVHLLLAEGAHNQFGDLPTTARIEMLIEQFILSRDEIQDFLGGRVMVPYKEGWMDRIDSMKTLQGWTNTSISYFYDLANYGEQILLSIRWGSWANVDDSIVATEWAVYWRDAIQRYIHSYRIVTGVDLTFQDSVSIRAGEENLQPSLLINRRVQQEFQNGNINGEYIS